MKKSLRTIVILVIGVLLSACGSKNQTVDGDHEYSIGILQFMEHNSLSAARDGFMAELEASDLNINFEVMNGQGDQSNLQSMSEQLANDTDLMLAIATPAAQSLATVEQEKPILQRGM